MDINVATFPTIYINLLLCFMGSVYYMESVVAMAS